MDAIDLIDLINVHYLTIYLNLCDSKLSVDERLLCNKKDIHKGLNSLLNIPVHIHRLT